MVRSCSARLGYLRNKRRKWSDVSSARKGFGEPFFWGEFEVPLLEGTGLSGWGTGIGSSGGWFSLCVLLQATEQLLDCQRFLSRTEGDISRRSREERNSDGIGIYLLGYIASWAFVFRLLYAAYTTECDSFGCRSR